MRQFYLTLLLLMMATGTARADSYLYMNDVSLQDEQIGTTIELPVRAYFDARVSDFIVDFYLPDGVDFMGVEPGDDMPVAYTNQEGYWVHSSPKLVSSVEDAQHISCLAIAGDVTDTGYWMPSGGNSLEPYGEIKWEADEYAQMLIIHLKVNLDYGYDPLEIRIQTTPHSTQDPRGGTVIENGDNGQTFEMVSVIVPPSGPIPVTPMPVITWYRDECGVFISAEGEGEVCLYIDGIQVENPYYIYTGYCPWEGMLMATAQNDGWIISDTYQEYIYTFPPDLPEPELTSELTDSAVIVTAQNYMGEVVLFYGDEMGDGPTIAVPRFEQDRYDVVMARSVLDCQSAEHFIEVFVPRLGSIYDFEEDGIYYKITGDHQVMVTFKDINYNSYSGDVNIPEQVTYNDVTYTVTAIRDRAFYGCWQLTNVNIGNAVTSIGDYAFYYCQRLAGVTFGDNVTTIGQEAFYNCTALVDLTIPNSVTRIGNSAFYHCSRLENLTIGDGTLEIGIAAFESCNALNSVTLGNGLKMIGARAFNGCSKITSLRIPDSVTKIGMSAFMSCSKLAELTLGNSLDTIGDRAFYQCRSLSSLKIPASVTKIGESAFASCKAMKRLTIGSSVSWIGGLAFYGCDSLQVIYSLPVIPPTIGNNNYSCFKNVYNKATLYVPGESVEAYDNASVWSNFMSIVGLQGAGPGDVTGDGRLSISDVTSMIDAILRGDEDVLNNPYADVNGDGKVNISDITALINMLLSGTVDN